MPDPAVWMTQPQQPRRRALEVAQLGDTPVVGSSPSSATFQGRLDDVKRRLQELAEEG